MNALALFGNLGMPELLVVLVILLLLFGGSRLPQLASGLGKSIRSFKRGMTEGEEESELEEGRRREALGGGNLENEGFTGSKTTVNRSR